MRPRCLWCLPRWQEELEREAASLRKSVLQQQLKQQVAQAEGGGATSDGEELGALAPQLGKLEAGDEGYGGGGGDDALIPALASDAV